MIVVRDDPDRTVRADRMLGRHHYVVLDTLLPAGAHPDLPRGLFETGFEAFYAEFERQAVPSLRLGLRFALWVATWVSPLLIGRLPPLARHDRTTRERALEAMGSSRHYLLRQLLLALKTVASLCYGADPLVRDAIGFPRGDGAPPA